MASRVMDDAFAASAIEWARSGACTSVDEIEAKLLAEGCSNPGKLLEPGWLRDELYGHFSRLVRPS